MNRFLYFASLSALLVLGCTPGDAPPPTIVAEGSTGGTGTASTVSDAAATSTTYPMIDLGQGTAGGAGAASVCEGVSPPLLRPGCPDERLEPSDCDREGLSCLYRTDERSVCYEEWECVFGIWSPRGTLCERNEPPVDDNSSDCPLEEPVPGTPCLVTAVECGYGFCVTGPSVVTMTCECGRWQRSWSCPTVP
jgi:hypothetical protein